MPEFISSTVWVSAAATDIDLGAVVLEVASTIIDFVELENVLPVPIVDPFKAEPIATTLCELLKSLSQFHGKLVQVHARVNPPGIDTGPFFVDYACSAWVAIGTAIEPAERTYLNYLFERYVGERRGFDVTFRGRFELQLIRGEEPAPYLKLQNVLDISAVQRTRAFKFALLRIEFPSSNKQITSS